MYYVHETLSTGPKGKEKTPQRVPPLNWLKMTEDIVRGQNVFQIYSGKFTCAKMEFEYEESIPQWTMLQIDF